MITRNLNLMLILSLWIFSQSFALGQYETEITVALDGSGDFKSIQKAIDNAKAFPDQRVTIYIKAGTYREKVKVHSWNTSLTLQGESKEKTIITFDDHFGKIDRGRNSTFHTYTLLVEGNDFHAENLTIQNTAGKVGQAIALAVNADRCSFINCLIKGNQDTVYASGEGDKHYFKNCFIEGTTDFIFGPATVFFEGCEIYSKENSYITAASTPEGINYGYVFKQCSLTAAKGVTTVFLGRPWRLHAKTVFVECEMGEHIRPEGWHDWSKPEARKTAFYAEVNCLGPGYKPQQRVKWSHQLNKSEVAAYTRENVLTYNEISLKRTWYLQRELLVKQRQ